MLEVWIGLACALLLIIGWRLHRAHVLVNRILAEESAVVDVVDADPVQQAERRRQTH